MRNSFGQALFITFAILANVVVAVLYIPVVLVWRVLTGVFAILVFSFCGLLVMVYKFSAMLAKMSRR